MTNNAGLPAEVLRWAGGGREEVDADSSPARLNKIQALKQPDLLVNII
jgi:hypothetical protein